MKKLIYILILIASFNTVYGQIMGKKWSQISLRGGIDAASKNNSTYITKPLQGINIGLSYDKYWKWYGIGADIDFISNKKPVYDDNELANYLATPGGYGTGSTGWYNAPFITAIPSNATKLNRMFVGIGPSLKLQNKKNNFVAELNLRGGVTYTNGSALTFSTISSGWAGFYLKDGSSPSNPYVYNHKGYDKDMIATAKAQARFSYYFNQNFGINVGAYYMHYWGDDARYDYLSFAAPFVGPKSSPWYGALPVNSGLSSLSSMGANIGITYRWGKLTSQQKNQKNTMTVTVNDELTRLPLQNVEVSIVNANGKEYKGITNSMGIVNFDKIDNGTYTVSGLLNEISTNQQSASTVGSNGRLNVALTHNDPRFTLQGKAINITTNQPEGGVNVTLKNNTKASVKMGNSLNGTGQFGFQLDANSDFEIVGKKDSYLSNIEKLSTKGLNRSQTLYVELELGVQEVKEGKSVVLNQIFYDLNKADIRKDASSDLEKLVIFLQDNPLVKIEIASHTDSRGSDDYNLKLSQERAQAVVNYLSQRGIATSRLMAKGYGESQLMNQCGNNVECTEEQHQINRRTEFKIIK